jgi:hypothetical protein
VALWTAAQGSVRFVVSLPASDEDRFLAALVRRQGETLVQFLMRLDQAIDNALTEDIYTDELNAKS